jgi:LacI family transcriptional regulator
MKRRLSHLPLALRELLYEYRFVKSVNPITMRQVAESVGVAVSTVSKGLRNDPTIPQGRCMEIQQAANRLGYRPHPLVATLMSQMHHHRRRSDPHHIAWIDLWPDGGEQCIDAINTAPILSGARERAHDLGYGIDVYQAGRDGLTPESLHRILTTRGQWGVIFPPVPAAAGKFPLDLRGLTGVTIGTSLHEPVMHRVSPNHFQGCGLAFERLRAKGFRRIGLALTKAMNERVEGRWLGSFHASQQSLPKRNQVSPLLVGKGDHDGIAKWLRRENPDAVLVAENLDWPGSARSKEPKPAKPFIAWLMLQAGSAGGVGLNLCQEQLGRVAVEMVVAQIHRNERGSPAIPHSVLIDAVWVESLECHDLPPFHASSM